MKTLLILTTVFFIQSASFAGNGEKYKINETLLEQLFSEAENRSSANPVTWRSANAKDDCLNSYYLGVEDASKRLQIGWALLAVPGGLCGVIGAMGFPVAATYIPSEPDYYPPGVEKECYRLGWQAQTLKKRNVMMSIGFATSAILIVTFYIFVFTVSSSGI